VNVVHDRPAARWLPSRHHFALARLIALLRVIPSAAERERSPSQLPGDLSPSSRIGMTDRLVLAIERDQSAIEIYSVAVWIFLTVACYAGALLPVPIGWAFLAGLVIAGVVIQIPVYVAGGVLVPLWNAATGAKLEHNQKFNSIVFMTLLVIASSWFGTRPSPVRYVAWFFFLVLVLNAAAWAIMAALRGKARKLEHQCGL